MRQRINACGKESLSSGIIRRDQLLVGWAPGGPVFAAMLLSAVAPLHWLLFTYYRRAVVREIREEAASRQKAVQSFASPARAAFSCRAGSWRSMAALRTRRRTVVMYMRLQQPNVVRGRRSLFPPLVEFLNVGIFPAARAPVVAFDFQRRTRRRPFEKTASTRGTKVPDREPRRPRSRADNQARSRFLDEPVIPPNGRAVNDGASFAGRASRL